MASSSPARRSYPGLVDDRTYTGSTGHEEYLLTATGPGSPIGAMHQLTQELDATRRDLESKEDLLAMTKREQERLRKLLNDTRDDFRTRVEELAGEKAAAENRVLEQRIEVERERGARKELQRELEDAINERERQVGNVAEVRKMVEGKLHVLMAELQKKDEQLVSAQQLVDTRGKDKGMVHMLEKMLATRDQQLSDVSTEYATLQGAHNRSLVANASLQQEVDAHRILREAQQQQHDLQDQQHQQALSLLAASSPSTTEPSPARGGNLHHRAGSQQSAHNDTPGYRVEHPSLLLPSQVAFAKDVMKDHTSMNSQLDTVYDDLTDLRSVLLKGTQHSTDHTDRKRLAALRQLDLSLQEQRRVGDGGTEGDSPEHLQATMRLVREGTLRVKTTMSALTEFVKELKGHAEKHCPYGLETPPHPTGGVHYSMAKPPAWPSQHSGDNQANSSKPKGGSNSSGSGTPTEQQQNNNGSFSGGTTTGAAAPSSPLQHQGTAIYNAGVSGGGMMMVPAGGPYPQQVLQDVEHRLQLSEDTVTKLRSENLEKDKELSKLRLDIQDGHHKVSLTENNLLRVEGHLKRATDELGSARDREKVQDARLGELQKELSHAHDITRTERERNLTGMSEKLREHEVSLQTVHRETEFKVRELEQKHDGEVRQLQSKLDHSERAFAELTGKEARSAEDLHKYTERIQSLKQQKKSVDQQLDEVKDQMITIAEELRFYKEAVTQSDQERQHLQAVLDFEVSQRATDSLVGMGLNSDGRRGPTATSSHNESSGMGMLGQDDGGTEWKEWKKSRTGTARQPGGRGEAADGVDHLIGGGPPPRTGSRNTAAPPAGVGSSQQHGPQRSGSGASSRRAPPGVKLIRGPSETRGARGGSASSVPTQGSIGRSSRF